jgi:hypothetical protein
MCGIKCCGFYESIEPAVLDRVGIKLLLERLRQHDGDPHHFLIGVCTENLIRVDDVTESLKLAERSGFCVSSWLSWPRQSSRR